MPLPRKIYRPSRAEVRRRWTEAEHLILMKRISNGERISTIARRLRRTPGAIRARLALTEKRLVERRWSGPLWSV